MVELEHDPLGSGRADGDIHEGSLGRHIVDDARQGLSVCESLRA